MQRYADDQIKYQHRVFIKSGVLLSTMETVCVFVTRVPPQLLANDPALASTQKHIEQLRLLLVKRYDAASRAVGLAAAELQTGPSVEDWLAVNYAPHGDRNALRVVVEARPATPRAVRCSSLCVDAARALCVGRVVR